METCVALTFGIQLAAERPQGARTGHDWSWLGRKARGARHVYHAVLATRLERAQSETDMQGGIGWFLLKFTDAELHQLIESARTRKVIEILNGSEDEWTLTTKGEKLSVPRGASALDLVEAARYAAVIVLRAIKDWWAVALVIAAGIGLSIVVGVDVEREDIIVAASLSFLAMVLAFGAYWEWLLGAAAEQWPRLQRYRPARYSWQTHPWRWWVVPLAAWLFVTCVTLALVEERHVLFVPGGLLAGGLLWVYLREIRPQSSAWLEEAKGVHPRPTVQADTE